MMIQAILALFLSASSSMAEQQYISELACEARYGNRVEAVYFGIDSSYDSYAYSDGSSIDVQGISGNTLVRNADGEIVYGEYK